MIQWESEMKSFCLEMMRVVASDEFVELQLEERRMGRWGQKQ